MNLHIRPIKTPPTACLGVCCAKHAQCARYLAIEASSPDDRRIATCGPEHKLFVPAQKGVA